MTFIEQFTAESGDQDSPYQTWLPGRLLLNPEMFGQEAGSPCTEETTVKDIDIFKA
jgi:hypothetical protein